MQDQTLAELQCELNIVEDAISAAQEKLINLRDQRSKLWRAIKEKKKESGQKTTLDELRDIWG